MERSLQFVFSIFCLHLSQVQGCSVLDSLARKSSNRTGRADLSFNYATQDQWNVLFPSQCAGSQQSPINIKLTSCTITGARLIFRGWTEIPIKTTLKETKATVEIYNEYAGARPTITGGPLGGDTYVFFQAHFHWGENNRRGSEHYLNNKQYAMEAHIIFLNQKYPSVDEAFLNKDGVAVIGRFYDAGILGLAPAYSRYLISLLVTPEIVSTVGISLNQIAPGTNFKYATYKGSLTAPICREVITWIVGINDNFKISDFVINAFRNLLTEKSVVRRLQPTNGRALSCRLF